jgi:hypothetical protein
MLPFQLTLRINLLADNNRPLFFRVAALSSSGSRITTAERGKVTGLVYIPVSLLVRTLRFILPRVRIRPRDACLDTSVILNADSTSALWRNELLPCAVHVECRPLTGIFIITIIQVPRLVLLFYTVSLRGRSAPRILKGSLTELLQLKKNILHIH